MFTCSNGKEKDEVIWSQVKSLQWSHCFFSLEMSGIKDNEFKKLGQIHEHVHVRAHTQHKIARTASAKHIHCQSHFWFCGVSQYSICVGDVLTYINFWVIQCFFPRGFYSNLMIQPEYGECGRWRKVKSVCCEEAELEEIWRVV